MQFNPNTTSGIVYMTRFYAKASSSDLSLQDIVNLSNAGLDEIYPLAASNDRTLQFDDPSYADDPYEPYNLTGGTARYSLATDGNSAAILGIRKVAVSQGNGWRIIEPADIDSYGSQGFVEGTNVQGTPERYFQFGSSIVLDPTPAVSVTNGMRVFYRRALKYFTSADTTASPGFSLPFHELIPLIAAHRYALREGKTTLAQQLAGMISAKKEDMEDFYGMQGEDAGLRLTAEYTDPR